MSIKRMSLRLPAALHARLAEKAQAERRPLHLQILHYLERSLEQDQRVDVAVLRALGVPEETIAAALAAQRGGVEKPG